MCCAGRQERNVYRVNLHGAVHQLLFRELEINQVPQSISVAAGSHPPDQIVFAPRGERQDQQELGFFLPRQGGHYVSGLHRRRLSGLAEQAVRDLPDVFLVVKHLRIAHMKNTVSLGLREKRRQLKMILWNEDGATGLQRSIPTTKSHPKTGSIVSRVRNGSKPTVLSSKRSTGIPQNTANSMISRPVAFNSCATLRESVQQLFESSLEAARGHCPVL